MNDQPFFYKLIILFAVCVCGVRYDAAAQDNTHKIDSLLKVLQTQKEDTDRATVLMRIALEYRYSNPAKGITYAQQAVDLAQKMDWKPGMAKAYGALANNYMTQYDYLKAFDYYSKAEAIDIELGDKANLGKHTINMGILYFTQSNYPKALEYFFRALKIEDEIKNKDDIASCLMNIGIVYSRQEVYDKALEYFFRSLKLAEELGDKAGVAYNYGNIGLVYKAQKNYPKALEYYEKSLKLNESFGAKTYILADLGNIGNVYRNEKNYGKAFEYFFQSLKISEELQDKLSMSIGLGNIGECYLNIAQDSTSIILSDSLIPVGKNANLQRAKHYLEQALALSQEIGDIDGIQEVSKNLSEVMDRLGNYKAALDYHIQYTRYKDSMSSEKGKVKIASLETQRAIDLKERDLKIEKLKAANKRNERLLYISSIVLLLIAMGVVLNRFMKQARSNEQLASEKKKHLARIREQSNVLENMAHTQAHDVRGQVVKILGLVKLFNYDNLADPVNKELMENVGNVTEELDSMVKALILKENQFNKESKEKGNRGA